MRKKKRLGIKEGGGTEMSCSKLDFNYSREMTLDPLRSDHI